MMIPYILPFALYVVLTQIPPKFPLYYPLLYAAVVLGVAGVTGYFLIRNQLLRPHWKIVPGLAVGVMGIALWILLCHLNVEQHIVSYLPDWLKPESRPGFNPFETISDPILCWGFIIIRMIGLAILVPVAEELFWRGFLMRWIISPAWESQEIGRFTLGSFAWVVLLFTLAHPEWLAAAVYCTLLNALIYWKKDLWNCVIAHSTSNLILGSYVLYTQTWQLW